MEPFLQASGHDADYAGMPAFATRDQDTAIRITLQGLFGLCGRLIEDRRFDGLALIIERMQALCEGNCLGTIIRSQQFCRNPWVADPPACIEAWTEHERRMIDAVHLADAGDFRQCAQAFILAARQNAESLPDKGAVHAAQGRHVAQGSKRGEVQEGHDVR